MQEILPMNKQFTLFAIFILLLTEAYGQKFAIEWGPEIEFRGAPKIFDEYNGSAYAMRYYKGESYFEKYNIETLENEVSFPIDLKVPKSKAEMDIKRVYLNNGNITILATLFDKRARKHSMSSLVFNDQGEVLQDWTELVSFTVASKKVPGFIGVRYSSDEKQIYIIESRPDDETTDFRRTFYAYDLDLNLSWKKTIEIDYKEDQTGYSQFEFSNDGWIHILTTLRPESKKGMKTALKSDQDFRKRQLLSYNSQKDEFTEMDLDLDNKTIINSEFSLDSSNNIIFAGLYYNNLKEDYELTGAFYMRIIPGSIFPDIVTTNIFSDEFIHSFNGEEKSKKKHTISPNHHNLRMVPLANGKMILLTEYHYTTTYTTTGANGQSRTVTINHHENIMVLGFDQDGQMSSTNIIHKKSIESNFLWYGYGFFTTDDKIHVIIFDDYQNLLDNGKRLEGDAVNRMPAKHSICVIANIDSNCQVEYVKLYDLNELKVRLQLGNITKLDNNQFLIIDPSGKRSFRLGRMHE